jgi:hypothetical protein
MKVNEFTWLTVAQRGEAGHSAAWLLQEQVIGENYPPTHTTTFPILSLTHHLWREV